MATTWKIQSNFTKGEVDPLLAGRNDAQVYYQAVQEATNVLSTPQGGLIKRNGTEFLGHAIGVGRLENFSFNTEQNYLFVFTNLRLQIYKDGVLLPTIDGFNNFLVTPWTTAQIPDFDYIQSADTAIIVHPDVSPRFIGRNSDIDWDIAVLPLVNIPQFNYFDASSPTPVSEIQDINFTGVDQGNIVRLSLEGIATDDFAYEGPNSDMAAAIREQLQALPNTASTGISCVFTGGSIFDSDFRITLAGASANNWRLIVGTHISGLVTGDEVITTTRVQAGTSQEENVWSGLRGWPVTCTFHEARLWFGGSRSRIQTLWGSNVNNFFDFAEGKGRDDEGIDVTLGTNQVNAIQGLLSNRALQVFTSGGEFFIKESPVTPGNVAVIPQTNLGSKRVRPVTIDGVTIYAQRTGKALQQFLFLNDLQANASRNLSVVAAHLILDPKELVTSQGTETADANYIYIVNNDSPDMTVFSTLSSEDVGGFTRWDMEENIISCAVVDNRVNLLTVDDKGIVSIVQESPNTNTDSNIFEVSVNGPFVDGLDHLEGKTVDAIVSGAYQGQFVVSGGRIKLFEPGLNLVEVGLPYRPTITTMPLNMQLKQGPNAALRKRVARVALTIHESNGILVNGQRIADRTIGENQFDPPIPQTGVRRIYLGGYSIDALVTITQTTPMDMNILSINMEVVV